MKIAVVGDIGVDIYVNKNIEKVGGIGFNFAYHVVKNSAQASLISIVGDDNSGYKLLSLLKKTTIDHSHVSTTKGTTPIQKILLKDNGDRKFVGYTAGVLQKWKLHIEDMDFIAKHDAVFVPMSDGMKHIFEAITQLSTTAIKVADFSQDSEYADFEKSDNSITKYSKYFTVNFVGATIKQQSLLSLLSKKYPEKVYILTLGSKGSIGFKNGKEFIQPTAKVIKIVDATGAGDAFQAAFSTTYFKTKDIQKSLKYASGYAAKATQYLGATKLI